MNGQAAVMKASQESRTLFDGNNDFTYAFSHLANKLEVLGHIPPYISINQNRELSDERSSIRNAKTVSAWNAYNSKDLETKLI